MPENHLSGLRRVVSVDLLRGLVMIVMLLDHTREYVNVDSFVFSPTDLTQTTVPLFFTRWITHFCAPAFVFLAGVSIYLQRLRGKTGPELTRFLLTRGIWLIILEFTVVRFAIVFNLDYSFLGAAEVIWIFGVSMVIMSALVRLPAVVNAAFGLIIIFGHNAIDQFAISPASAMAGTPPPDFWQTIWMFLHQPGFVTLFGGASKMLIAYPLLPWVGLMAAGYALGLVYGWDDGKRRKTLVYLGTGATVLFIVLRAVNIYGDPSPWQHQPSAVFTLLSFLNVTKYPVSLLFLLMTLGPAMLFLSATDRDQGNGVLTRIVLVYGRVPLFYFILQMFFAHLAGVVLGYLAGFDVGFWFTNYPFAGDIKAPQGFGFSLAATYGVWIAGVIILYPICRWYGDLKARRRHWALSYL